MRAIVGAGLAVVLAAGCGRAGSDPAPDGSPARCAGALPSYADGTRELVARCGDLEITATPLAGGVIELRYAHPGDPPRASWAVIEKLPDPDATTGSDGGEAALCTSAMTVRIDDACQVTARLPDGSPVLADAAPFADGRLERRGDADRVYGLGERTGGLDRRGRAWTFWNTDAYDPAFGGWKPDQDPLYQSIPFEVRFARGVAYGLFTDETRRMTIDLSGARDVYDAPGARSLDQYVIAGPRIADVVERYTALTGRPMLPPRWTLGFHQSRWGYPDGATLEAIADRFRAEQIPADALWLDIQHLRGFRSFTNDDAAFPPGTIERLAAKGFHVVAIADPGIKVDPGWDVYDDGVAGGHFLRTADGGVYQGTAWPGAAVFPDLSRASTRAWWGAQVDRVAARGVGGIWLDVNEPTTFPEGGGGTLLTGRPARSSACGPG